MGSFQFPSLLNSRPENAAAALLRSRTTAPTDAKANKSNAQDTPALGFGRDRGGEIATQFESAVYSAQYERIAFSARLQEVAAALGDDEGAQVQAAARQLEFTFLSESRSEEVALFRERTNRVAAGQETERRETLAQLSQKVASRFEFSLSISGAALDGFASAAEGAQSNEDLLDQVLGFSQQVLEQAFEKINEAFETIGDFFKSGGDVTDFASRINEIFQGFFNDLTGQSGSTPQAGGPQTGQAAAAFASVQLEFNFSFSAEVSVQQGAVQQSDPITFDLDNDGLELTSYRNGARFDILGNGSLASTAFVTGGDAFLALDRNGNGSIDSGAELFGDQRGAVNGYEELRKLDSNGDNRIDRNDTGFDSLKLFRDNGNGRTEEGELISLADAGITEISLGYTNVDQVASGGNRLAQIASFRRSDGTLGKTADAILNYTA
ncbi:MAG: hypothetical protein IT368_18090 [Candidatus Hydrogenedentes bacterium]|nr:hypothetical protein [Candidatus Hydrogenedentota bacterium]